MALKDANLIPFQIRQRQFLKEVFLKLSERMHAQHTVWNNQTEPTTFNGFFWHLGSFPIRHHSIIKILNFHKRFQVENEFICQRGIVVLPEINMFTFISLLLRIRNRFTCPFGLFVVHNQFIYFVWNFQANDVNAQFILLILHVTRWIPDWSQRIKDLL